MLGFSKHSLYQLKAKTRYHNDQVKTYDCSVAAKGVSCLGALGGRQRLNWKLHATIQKHVMASSGTL